MFLKLTRWIIVFIFFNSIVSCSPAPENNMNKSAPSKSTEIKALHLADVVGLWDSSEIQHNKKDIMYTRIAQNGDILEYDYDGDKADNGIDCYQVESGKISRLNKNVFLVKGDLHNRQAFKIKLTLSQQTNALKVDFLTQDSTNESGESETIIKTQHWHRADKITIFDNEPSCSR